MNLENVWMFNGDAFYCTNELLFLEPLMKYAGFDLEQFTTVLRQSAKQQPKDTGIMRVHPNGIAQLAINGALMPNKSLVMQAMGGTSTNDINNAFQRIKNDPKIKGVLMQVNSGGGSSAGIDGTAALIHEVNQQVPVVAHVTGHAASAAYYLASQASKIFVSDRTSMIGSIGTRLVLDDSSQAAANAGVERVVIQTGPLKSVGLAGTKITSEQKAHLQSQVNQLQGFFEQSVKRGRPNLDINAINDGSVWLAAEAQNKGLIDAIQSPSKSVDVLRSLIKIRNS